MKTLSKILLLFCVFSLALSCRNEEEDNRPRIEKITFEEEIKKTYEGDTVKITVIAEPREAKAYDKIKYWVSGSDVLEILPESDNDGVVFKGLKAGKAVIQASVNGISAFSSVTVIGAGGTIIPYIISSDYVIECEKGARENIVASLVGGSPADESGFSMSHSGQNIINLVQTNNIGIIEAANTGASVITISHIKAQFSVNVLVFVKEKGDAPVYITTDDNVINLNVNDNIREYAVNLLGRSNNDYHLFRHEILDGNDIIDLKSSNNIGSITPKARGIARIKVSHSNADHPIEMVVIVNEEIEYKYIDVDSTLIVMNEGDFRVINADIVGNVPQDYINKYVFENENDSVIEISNSYYQASIRALKKGKSIIKIKNDYVDFDREVLVVVNGPESVIDQEKYITTNQNVITTEVNGEVQLTMALVGGNSADANNFVWTVDDGSIIEVTSQHGSVQYRGRAVVLNEGEKFETTAMIKAKKIGTATITLENPKAHNSFSVVVKVYKQGIFGVIPVVIDGPGIFKIEEGQSIDAQLRVVTGLEKSMTNIKWKSGNEHIVSVVSNAGLTGILKGLGEGITTLTVTGDNVKNDYTATVIVGSKNYLNGKPYIYVNNPYISVIKEESVYFRVECVNLAEKDMSGLSVVNNSGDVIELFAYRNNITVKGLSLGEGEIIVSGDGLNELKITVMVEDYALNPEMPFYLRPDKFIYGMVKGRSIEIPVDLVGGIASNEKDIGWKIEDSSVAEIKGNGKKCIVTGKNEGQTVLTASHHKSHNDVKIVIYVALSDAELKSKVIIHVPDQNLLLKSGETRFISVITNAVEGQNDFRWGTSNANVVTVRPSGDKKKTYIDAVSVGNAQITVGYGNQVPVVIYVSVINSSYDLAYINVPSIVEMTAGQTITIKAATNNINNKYEITWVSKDESIARAYGNGDSCAVTAFKGGKAVLEVRYPGFAKDIVLRVYSSSEEMASAYIFAGEQSRYAINKGDIVNIGLVFGIKGYPEHDMTNIRWSAEDGSRIEVNGNGKTASVKGLAAGIGVVSVQDNYGNDVKIEIVVQDAGKAGKYYFSIDKKDRIKGILAGSFANIEVKVFNGTAEIYNISGIESAVEKSDIIRVENNDGGIRVYALAGKEGQSYITLKHDLVEDAKILIYTSLTEGGLLNAYPIMVEKSNYLVERGDNFSVSVQTLNEDSSKLRNISYDLEKKNGVLTIQERSKKEIMVNAESEGSEVILVRYNAEIVQRVYVSVVEKGYGLNAGYMVTENIIGLLKGQRYETRVDIDADWGIVWRSEKDYICDLVEIEGKRAVLRANGQGETLITVRKSDVERHIFVFVVETQEELDAYNAVNIEQRKYKIRKGDSVSVNIHSFQGRVEGRTVYADYYGNSAPYGNVIAVSSAENNKLSVKGINEGTAAIKITNEYYQSEIVVYVEVYPAGDDGSVGVNNKEHYITAEKTLYVIGPEENDVNIQVGVLPGNFYGDAYWEWTTLDEDIIQLDALGRSAVFSPVKEGRTKITVSNKECANSLEITVIVGERFVSDGGNVPYIYVEKDLFEVVKGSAPLSIPYNIVNVSNVVLKNITYQLYGDGISVSHDVNSGVFNVQAVKTGIARFDIKYGSLRREVYVLVGENINSGNIYLTTSENFVIASKGELRNISIDLKGYDEIDSSKFKWSISDASPKNVLQLVGNGLVGQIYGVSEGSVVINVEHTRNDGFRAAYPLSINVKIVKDKSKEKIVYLTTQRNVIETIEGSQSDIIYVQKVGGDVTKTHTTWDVGDKSIASLDEINGYSARLNVHKAGSTEITVKNIEADYELKIVVVVRESTGSNVYISSTSSLIWISPGEKNYRIKVDLVNGETKDYNKITWKVRDQIPSDPNILAAEGKVIGIVSSNEQCLIDAVNVGVAHIRVECPGRADLPLIITVYVSHYKEIQFSASRKSIVKDEVDIVELNLPTYERMKDKARVWAEDLNGGITNAVDVYYTNSLVMLHARKVGHAVIKAAVEGKEGCAEMTVSVLERHDPNVNRVVVGKNIHVLSARSAPVILNASVTGPDIYESDIDNIKWEVTRNYNIESDPENKKPLVDIIPKVDSPTSSKGRTIQLTAQNEGNAVLRVSHPEVMEDHWKDIYIVVAEMGNRFTIDKKEVTVNMLRPETVAVNIIGGTTRDYEEVKWVAKMQQKWDGTLLEVVRVMGSGREVTLYPISNGETEVYAFYNGDFVSVKVAVVSDYFFEFYNSNEFMYPGEVRNLPFDIKPASSNVNWIYNRSPDAEPVISYTEIQGSQPGGSGSINRFLQITARTEGTASLVGMANGKIATVNIVVAYDYEFVLNARIPGILPVDGGRPKFENKNASGVVTDSSSGIVEIPYTIHPANTYIKWENDTIPGLMVEISDPVPTLDSKNRMVGVGTIRFTGLQEMVEQVIFQQYKARGIDGGEIMVDSTDTRPSQRMVQLMYYFTDVNPIPFFVRGEGKYSNKKNYTNATAIPVPNDLYTMHRNGTTVQNAEKMIIDGTNKWLTLGDGEEHYILFDKQYENANIDISGISAGNTYGWDSSNPDETVTLGGKFNAAVVDFSLNGVTYKAVRLSGDSDYIEYKRVAFDKELFLIVSSAYPNDIDFPATIEYVPAYEDEYHVNMQETLPTYYGPWLDFTTPSQNNTSYDYYLLRRSELKNITNSNYLNTINTHGKYITATPELYEYWNQFEKYAYCFRGNEVAVNPFGQAYQTFKAILDNYCDKVKGYRPLYCYNYTTYNNNISTFENNHVGNLWETMMMDERSGRYVGGYFYSYYAFNSYLQDKVYGKNVNIYAYDKEFIKTLISLDLTEFNRNLSHDYIEERNGDYTEIFLNWYAGEFNDDVIPYVGNSYDPNTYLYSSYAYTIPSHDYGESAELTTKYNVFKRSFEGLKGVHILDENSVFPLGPTPSDYINDAGYDYREYYRSGCSYAQKWLHIFSYKNIKLLPAQRDRVTYKYVNGVQQIKTVKENVGGVNSYAYLEFPDNILSGSFLSDAYSSLFSYKHYHGHAPNGGCWPGKGGRPHSPSSTVYRSVAKARQWVEWENNGIRTTAPYYTFNRFPFRLLRIDDKGKIAEKKQILGVNHGNSKPMPSLSRNLIADKSGTTYLYIHYSKFAPDQPENRFVDRIPIPIKYETRACHSQYMGDKTNDGLILFDYNMELEGPEKTFDKDITTYNNKELSDFIVR